MIRGHLEVVKLLLKKGADVGVANKNGITSLNSASHIRNVHKIAKKHFGSKVHFWHEMNETGDERQWGYYDWQEVHDASKKLRELETGQ